MKKLSMTLLFIVLFLNSQLFSQNEFVKDGRTFKYIWHQYLDAKILSTNISQTVLILALREGVLQQKAGKDFAELRKVVGLFIISVDKNGKVMKNELELDLTTRALEKFNLNLIQPATLNARMFSACTDETGQLHVFVAATVMDNNGKFQNRLYYLRKNKAGWEDMITSGLGYFPYNITCYEIDNSVYVNYVRGIGNSDLPLISHQIETKFKITKPQWLLFGAPGNALTLADYTAFKSSQGQILLFHTDDNVSFNYGEIPANASGWNIKQDAFIPKINNTIIGGVIKGYSGGCGIDGSMHLFGVFDFNSTKQIIYIHKLRSESSWKTEIAFNQSADWLSVLIVSNTIVHIIGITQNGDIWYANNVDKNFSSKGIILKNE